MRVLFHFFYLLSNNKCTQEDAAVYSNQDEVLEFVKFPSIGYTLHCYIILNLSWLFEKHLFCSVVIVVVVVVLFIVLDLEERGDRRRAESEKRVFIQLTSINKNWNTLFSWIEMEIVDTGKCTVWSEWANDMNEWISLMNATSRTGCIEFCLQLDCNYDGIDGTFCFLLFILDFRTFFFCSNL